MREETRSENILDLVLTNNCDMVHSITVRNTNMSDHRLVVFSLSLPLLAGEEPLRAADRFGLFNFFSPEVDWNGLSNEISRVG